MSASEAAAAFNACINARDLEALAVRMTDDHKFIDTAGAEISGKAACVAAWRAFFDAFPDYENVFKRVIERGDTVIVEGYARCTDARLAGPALWSAKIARDRVREWRVWEDTPANRTTLGLV